MQHVVSGVVALTLAVASSVAAIPGEATAAPAVVVDGDGARGALYVEVAADGASDDSAAAQRTIDAAPAGARIVLPAGKVIGLRAGLVIDKPIHLDCNGATLRFLAGTAGSPRNSYVRIESALGTPWTAGKGPLSPGQRTFTFDAPPDGIRPGDTMFMTLGTDPYDRNEERVRMFNVVESVAGAVVTFRAGVPEAIPAGASTHKLYRPKSIAENVTVENCSFDFASGVTPDQTVLTSAARNVTIRNLFGARTAGAVEVRESENVLVENVYFQRGDGSLHSASGRIIAGWGTRNLTARNIYGLDVDGSAVMFEGQMRGATIENLHVGSGAHARSTAVLHVVGGSTGIRFRGVSISSAVPRTIVHEAEGAQYTIEDVSLSGPVKGLALRRVRGALSYGGTLYANERTATRTVPLLPRMKDVSVALPSGIVKRIRAYVSHDGVTQLSFLNGKQKGADVASSLVPGTTIDISTGPLVGVGSEYSFNSDAAKRMSVNTSGTVPAGATLVVVVEYFAPDGDDAVVP